MATKMDNPSKLYLSLSVEVEVLLDEKLFKLFCIADTVSLLCVVLYRNILLQNKKPVRNDAITMNNDGHEDEDIFNDLFYYMDRVLGLWLVLILVLA